MTQALVNDEVLKSDLQKFDVDMQWGNANLNGS